jgi:hypothetical protein
MMAVKKFKELISSVMHQFCPHGPGMCSIKTCFELRNSRSV